MWAVGGLFQVGFAGGRDRLLVLSSDGRGVFDRTSGEKVARDDAEPMDTFDPIRLTAPGFGPLEGEPVRMAGLFGGGLPVTTEDCYMLEEHSPRWPRRGLVLVRPDRSRIFLGDDSVCELRAFGFSETGVSFVVATSCDLTIYNRPHGTTQAGAPVRVAPPH